MKPRWFLAPSFALLLPACGNSATAGSGGANGTGGSNASGGTAGVGGSGNPGFGGACAAHCGENGCPACDGASMIGTHDPRGNSYRIDSTEVTNSQYGTFLSAKVDPSSQPAYCSWNTSFAPDDQANTGCQGLFDPVNRSSYPVVCVNWCDAYAYCRWAGKDLCGDFSYEQQSTPDISRPSQKWGRACSGGVAVFPYGNAYQPKTCNGVDYGADKLLPVSSPSTCVGGLPGLYDMSGNAAEWVGNCSASNGSNDSCVAAGGTYLSDQNGLACNDVQDLPRSTANYVVGFRCCAD